MARLFKPISAFEKLFGRSKSVIIGAVHLEALPGTPRNSKSIGQIIDGACSDADIYLKHGVVSENIEPL